MSKSINEGAVLTPAPNLSPLSAAAPLAEDEQVCTSCGKFVKKAALQCRFCNYVLDPAFRAEHGREEADRARLARMRAYLRQSGVGWLIVAVLQFVFSGFLSAEWGAICLVMGVVSLAFPFRPVLCLNGLAMILIGVGNAGGSLAAGKAGFMTYLGVMQVIWGVKELKKFATGEVQDNRK